MIHLTFYLYNNIIIFFSHNSTNTFLLFIYHFKRHVKKKINKLIAPNCVRMTRSFTKDYSHVSEAQKFSECSRPHRQIVTVHDARAVNTRAPRIFCFPIPKRGHSNARLRAKIAFVLLFRSSFPFFFFFQSMLLPLPRRISLAGTRHAAKHVPERVPMLIWKPFVRLELAITSVKRVLESFTVIRSG